MLHSGDRPDALPTVQRPRRRRRATEHICEHCERTFKRSEHLQRHVRTHTKEKPFLCRCGAAFTRRDLLTRHHRLSKHGDDPCIAEVVAPQKESEFDRTAAAESLSCLSGANVQPWPAVHHTQPVDNAFGDLDQRHPDGPNAQDVYQQSFLGPQMFNPDDDLTGFDQFREFADFLDGIGLPAEWSPHFKPPEELVDPGLRNGETGNGGSGPTTRPGTPFSSWLPSAPAGNRIIGPATSQGPRAQEIASVLFKVTEEQSVRLSQALEAFRPVLGRGFQLPSRHALTRYITSYFEGFHTHMVFIHVPTFRVLDCPIELVLSIAAIGAQYCFEHRASERLFWAGRSLVLDRLLQKKEHFGLKTRSLLGMHSPSSDDSQGRHGTWEPIDAVRTLINLMAFATWEPKVHLVQEAFSLQSLLAQVLRDLGLGETVLSDNSASDLPINAAWAAWAHQEAVRRAKLIAFSFIHVHSIAYNVYPVLRTNELHLRLPCETKVWKASTAQQWYAAHCEIQKEQLYYQEALSLLLKTRDSAVPLNPIPTALGNYLLLHGLLQRIYIVRDLSLPIMDSSASLPVEEVDKLDRGLRAWTTGWQQAPESSLDPQNENGPIPFTSSSLLGLAYVRIFLNLGPYRHLESRDPDQIARSLCNCPNVERSDGVITALLYATHAISIPVRLGIDRVARSQAFFWSVRHSLSGLECAVLLSKWLFTLHETSQAVPPTGSEERIISWVRRIVEEALAAVDFEEEEVNPVLNAEGLGMAVLKIWAHFFKSNTQWPFINIIGESLERYRKLSLDTPS